MHRHRSIEAKKAFRYVSWKFRGRSELDIEIWK